MPGHWAEVEPYADHTAPLLYRHRFTHPSPAEDQRLWLRFDGVLSTAEVWLDGTYVGDAEGYFSANSFEVTTQMAAADEHVLAVEVSCPVQGQGSRTNTSLTGSLQTGPLAPSVCPGGIWRPVSIERTGPVAIRHARLLCTKADADQAELLIRLVLHAVEHQEVRIDTSVLAPDGEAAAGGAEHHQLASGENRIEWTVPIDRPQRWWPAALAGVDAGHSADGGRGDQPRYDVSVAVRLADGAVSDRTDWRTGLRRIDIDNHLWSVNGHRLFVKGIAYGPADPFLNAVPADTLRDDLRTVREAGLDMVRVFGHIGRPEIYEEADRLGLLIWQDLPLVGGYSSKVRTRAKALARAAVDQLGHHPSVALWCGHVESNQPVLPEPGRGGIGRWPFSVGRHFARHILPTWNRSILDPIVGRELRNADNTRSTITRSGSLPSPGDPAGSDAHLWLGWHAGQASDLAEVLRRWPRLGAFPGGIGSQSVSVEDWDETAPTWAGAEIGAFNRYLPRRAYGNGTSWAAATRAYQADMIRTQIETLRRLKYRPTGGFCVFALADVDRAGGFGVLDSERRPKPAHATLIDACRPVVIIADLPPELVVPGEPLTLAVHAVNDLPYALGAVRVIARASAADGWRRTTTWAGELGADTCVKVGDFAFDAPGRQGAVEIDLELTSDDRLATNRYQTVVIPSAEAMRPATQATAD